MKIDYKKLEKKIDIRFRDKNLLIKSLTHKSFNKINNNEKLEFLGDRVLGLVMAKRLLEIYPEEKEGVLDKKFASLVNKKTCLEISKTIELEKYVLVLKPKNRKNIIEGFIKIIPGKREMLTNIWAEMDIQLSNYVRGKTIEIFIVGIAAAIIFASLGLKYSALLSVLVGLSVIIPYVGAFLVTIPIVVVGLLQFGLGTEFYLLIGLYLLLQALDGNLLVPIIF